MALGVFRYTYGIQVGYASYWFERRALPAPGGVGDQPALVMQQLDVLERVQNAVIAEDSKRRKKKAPVEKRG